MNATVFAFAVVGFIKVKTNSILEGFLQYCFLYQLSSKNKNFEIMPRNIVR
jgi:hypothetical protein